MNDLCAQCLDEGRMRVALFRTPDGPACEWHARLGFWGRLTLWVEKAQARHQIRRWDRRKRRLERARRRAIVKGALR